MKWQKTLNEPHFLPTIFRVLISIIICIQFSLTKFFACLFVLLSTNQHSTALSIFFSAATHAYGIENKQHRSGQYQRWGGLISQVITSLLTNSALSQTNRQTQLSFSSYVYGISCLVWIKGLEGSSLNIRGSSFIWNWFVYLISLGVNTCL